ncbi:MAG: PIG-L deacetylase family protein [Spirochaetota bacterium]
MTVLAVGCHPDDIEFMMVGTLFLLREKGADIHYINVANGSCGTDEHSVRNIVRLRRAEAKAAAAFLGAFYHESLVDDLMVYYEDKIVRRMAAIVREVAPDIMLVPSLEDYMEDHMNTARIAVTAAFCRGMKNYGTKPKRAKISKDIAVYHAEPYGLHDGMRKRIVPEIYIDITPAIEKKRKMLAMHHTQKKWLDTSQGMNAYLEAMTSMSAAVGSMSMRYEYAEGFRQHCTRGLSAINYDPLMQVLGTKAIYAENGRKDGARGENKKQ